MVKIQNYRYLILSTIILIIGVFVGYLIITQAQAPDIAYPVKELGNCKNEAECRNFCDVKKNMIPCINFAEQHNLISKEEAQRAKEFSRIGEGPGGCQGKNECEAYCDDNAHIDECLAFAERNNLIPADELEEAKKVAKALREGNRMPGGCTRKNDCEAYCDEPSHMEECVAFAEKAGLIPADELVDAKKAVQAMKSGIKPPGNCKGKKQCDAYCSEPSNMEKCMQFALDAGFMDEQERVDAGKMLAALKRGVKPLPCRGKEACETYCQDETHQEECVNFAIEAGFMKPEEAKMFKKTGGKGPGNCKGKEECENYCNNPANQETCFKFAQENGLIPQEDIEKMKEGMQKMKEGLQNAPSQVVNCLKSNLGTENFERIQAGTLTPGPQIGDQVRNCFEQFMPRPPEGPDGMMPPQGGPSGFRGPDGCASPEECQKYCAEHQEECMKWKQEQRPSLPTGEGPGEMMPPERMQMPPSGTVPGEMPTREMMEKMMPPGMQLPEGGMVPTPEMIQQMMQQGIKPPEGMMMPGEMAPPPPPPPSETPPPAGSNMFQIFVNFLKNAL